MRSVIGRTPMIGRTPIPAQVTYVGLHGAVVAAAAASVTSGWWVVPEAVCAFLAGGLPGRAGHLAAAVLAWVAAAVIAVALVPEWFVWAIRFVGLVLAAVAPWCAGRFVRRYRALVRAGWEHAARLERERGLVAEQARLRERTRIAQDMHDLLGHELSLIALSAGALKLSPGVPEEHRAAARDIRARAGAAVERLGEVIGVLREDTQAPPEDAGPADVEALVARAADAGLDVALRVRGETPGGLPPVVDRAVRRVVQEALTNVAKHAPDSPARVRMRHTREWTEVRVVNGPASGARGTPGHGEQPPGRDHRFGLIGLDERVRLAGGTFEAGPAGAGFTVRAVLPHRTAAGGGTPHGSGAPGPRADAGKAGQFEAREDEWDDRPVESVSPERRRARRLLGRSAAATVLVPLLTAAALIGGVRVWDTYTARASALDPHDYARLRPGQQSHAEVAPYLPERQTARRPADAGDRPRPPGSTCEFYVQTADPFDDRSGDLYRLCFRAGLLVSTDAFTGKELP
ncbi:histidine kinase [Streptomyces sp. NPDC002039]|uniref:sensor histidine kinase n=1 Tax=Streptomyces sp. NPDC002039 TaxID=3154660 RepID=UPI00332F75F2